MSGSYGESNLLVDITSSLDTLVHPFAAILVLVDRDRECLSAAISLGVDECDLELVWMVGERVCTRHAGCACTDDQDSFGLLQARHVEFVWVKVKGGETTDVRGCRRCG